MIKKEWLLISVSILGTLLIALGLLRWFAPHLLGIPVDLQLVKVQKEMPPFFDVIFRDEIFRAEKFVIPDPFIKRGKPLLQTVELAMGPNDILGFRNRQVPNIADIVTIGDSQTYGNNVPLEMNWPSILADKLYDRTNTLYNMSVGGWGATQYYEIFKKALYLQPIIAVVAFYTGNDPLDSFMQVYGDDRWQDWRPDTSITKSDAPKVLSPDNQSDQWQVPFDDGFMTMFTPAYRHASNKYDDPAVRAGYDIMVRSAEEIAAKARQYNVKIIFTIIPTKEFVYAKKIRDGNMIPRYDYSLLVKDEVKNISFLASRLNNIPGAIYVDVASRLQDTAVHAPSLYPPDINGHPNQFGYDIIARTLAPYVRRFLPIKPYGLVVEKNGNKNIYYVIQDGKILLYDSLETLSGNGWDINQAIPISRRFIENLPISESVTTINPERYGPDNILSTRNQSLLNPAANQ